MGGGGFGGEGGNRSGVKKESQKAVEKEPLSWQCRRQFC